MTTQHDWIDLEPVAACDHVLKRSPVEFPFGEFSVDTNGSGGFLWFRDAEEAASFLIAKELPAIGEATDEERVRMQNELGSIESSRGSSAWIERANEIMGTAFEIRWLGTFDTLCAADDEFCRDMRSQFREDLEEDPIRGEERDEFATFLQTYGF